MNRAARLRDWQRFTVELMVVGYAGYYLCRSNLSVSILAIAKEMTARGLRPTYRKRQTNWDGPSRWERSGTRWESSPRGAWSTSWVGVETT